MKARLLTPVALIAVFLAAAMLVAGCGSKKADDTKFQTPVDKAEFILKPKIKIISPAPGETLIDGNVKVEVNVANFQLAEMYGKGNTLGTGHLHYIVDGGAPIESAAIRMQINLPAGTHNVKIEVRQNDHSAFDPPVDASTTFTVDT